MKTVHGYNDFEKLLTREQWDSATTEQRSGFLKEGYLVVDFAIKKPASDAADVVAA